MADLKNITDRITKEAALKAEEIVSAGEAKALEMEETILKEALEKKNQILKRAELDAELVKERVLSAHSLSVRDKKLSERGKVIEKVMEAAREILSSLPDKDFVTYVKGAVGDREISKGAKVRVNPKYLNAVRAAFPSFDAEEDDKVTGFMIDNGGIVENHSFDSLMDFMKDDLEEIAARELFSKED